MRCALMIFLLSAPILSACSSTPASYTFTTPFLFQEDAGPRSTGTTVQVEEQESETEEGRSVFTSILLYIPNRILDVFDIARAGVSIGPGVGIDLTATKYLNLSLMTKTSVGVGYQTLRHLPVEAAAYASVGAGPFKAAADPGLPWYRSDGEIRVEAHALIVGAHVAVEPLEILDLIVGFIGIDLVDDDL